MSCAFCGKGASYEGGSLGPLLGPINDRSSGQAHFCHRLCAIWSGEVFETEHGTLRCVLAAIRRGRTLRSALPFLLLAPDGPRHHCNFAPMTTDSVGSPACMSMVAL